MKTISIAREFTDTPGARYKSDGPFSGEEFREEFLEPFFQNGDNKSKIRINLDGAAGYATSFLEEAFGGLARKYGIETCLKRLEFISEEEPLLKKEIDYYIKHCKDE